MSNCIKKYNKKQRFICLFFAFLLIFGNLFSSAVPVQAKTTGHDSYVIQPRFVNGKYYADVVLNSNSTGAGLEKRNDVNIGKQIIAKDSYSDYISGFTKDTKGDMKGSWGNYLYFSFPAHDSAEGSDNDYTNFAGDRARATKIANLVNTLNDVIYLIDSFDGRADLDEEDEFIAASKLLSNGLPNPNKASSVGDHEDVDIEGVCIIRYYFYNGSVANKNKIACKVGANGGITDKVDGLYAYVVPYNNGAKPTTDDLNNLESNLGDSDYLKKNNISKFVWAYLKGYLGPDGTIVDNDGTAYLDTDLSKTTVKSMGTELTKDSSDCTWITAFDLATIANYYYETEKKVTTNAATEVSWIEELIVEILGNFISGIKNLLGLKDITTLIYETGNNVSGGVMDNSWWSIMLKYHLIFQVVAWLLIGLAVAKLLLELNFSTINPQVRVSIFETLQKIFIVGFLLALAVPTMRLMIEVNNAVVGIFQVDAPPSDSDMFTAGNSLATLVMYFSYLGINLMLNCTYIMRGVMIAIFGASAPLFIVTMLFSKGKGMFDNWLKEMAANIFLQSVHAFAFSFLFAVIKSSSMLPKLVIFWSLMPITEQFRGFIFGSAGGFTTKQGNAMGSFIQKQVTATARTAASTGSNIAGKAMQNSKFGQKLGLKAAAETGNAEGVGGGGGGAHGRGGAGGGAGGNGGASVMKDAAKQMKASGVKGAKAMSAAGHALSGIGQIGGQMMDMMDSMTDIQNGDFASAGRGLDNVRAAASNMATSAADMTTEGISNAKDKSAEKRIAKAAGNAGKKGAGRNVASYANNYVSGNTKAMQSIAANGKGMGKAEIKEAKKLGQAMKRMGVSSISTGQTKGSAGQLNYGSVNGFQGRDGNQYSVVNSASLQGNSVDASAVFGEGAGAVKEMLQKNGNDYAIKDKKGNITGYSIAGVNFDKNFNVTNARALSTGVSNNGNQTYFNASRMTQNVMSSHENQQQRIYANQNMGQGPTNITNNITFSTPAAAKAYGKTQNKKGKN